VNLWHINEDAFIPAAMHSRETVFTIGNGYLGTRGSFEEGYPRATPATLLCGVFDSVDIGKEELASVPDWLLIKLFVNGERFRLDRGRILAYQRSLDMYNGILTRQVSWESPNGVRLTIRCERFASLAQEHAAAIRYTVSAVEYEEEQELDILLRATLNTAVANRDTMHWESLEQGREADMLWLLCATRHSDVQLAQTMSFTTSAPGFERELVSSDHAPSIHLRGKLAPGASVTAAKFVVMYTSRDVADPLQVAVTRHREITGTPAGQQGSPPHEPGAFSLFDSLLEASKDAWHTYWQTADFIIEGDEKAQVALRYNIYQLRISASTHDSRYSVAAKGLTGFGYLGHIFHDTEIFMLPYYTYVHPAIARNLLLYRYRLLPGARRKASKQGYEGAQYPWESTLDGDEATPDAIVHPQSKKLITVLNGIIELHITASIAYAAWRYWRISGDDEFMQRYGAEIMLSTATFWGSRAEKLAGHDDYAINDVIGPDEWHEHVNNNAYTNSMASWNIERALDALRWLEVSAPDRARELVQRLDVSSSRLNNWRDVAAHLRVPRDARSGVIEQFDGFFDLTPLDQEQFSGRSASYQSILGLPAMQRLRVIKQADVLMLLTLLRDDFDEATMRANWDYYYPITDHSFGSSLTPALHAILACLLGHIDKAYDLFMTGALVDMENLRGNTPEGIHAACAGAVWQAAALGFAGLRLLEDGGYTTSPSWPDGWTRMAFTCFHKGRRLQIDLRR
jgi:trehalose/maltose hydrolase-like predicted phosphorylase